MNTSMTSNICAYLDNLSLAIQIAPFSAEQQSGNYFAILGEISNIVQPLFNKIANCYENAGFEGVEIFQAAPKGRCENFVFLENQGHEFTHVILAKNRSKGFLQNGGGKTGIGESIQDAALRESKEEFNFPGTLQDMHYITTETESGLPIFHFAKGVHVGFVTPQEAKTLELGDDMKANEICKMSVPEFLEMTEKDTKPIDHGFDRKWIAEFIKDRGKEYETRKLTSTDVEMASKAHNWMKNIVYDPLMIVSLKNIVELAILKMQISGVGNGKWKDKDVRDPLRQSAQKVVDAMVRKLLPDWTYEVKGETKVGCQMKVQGAQGYKIDDHFLPSFLTAPQYYALQQIQSGKQADELIGLELKV